MQRNTTIVFTHGGGRLANQLFIHAHLLAFCVEHAPRFSLFNAAILPYRDFLPPKVHRYGTPSSRIVAAANVLMHPGLDRFQRHRLEAMHFLLPNVPWVSNFDGLMAASDTSGSVMLSGWEFASDDSLFKKHASTVVPQMALRFDAKKVGRIVGAARSQSDRLVGVHIRHGDYATFVGGNFMFTVEEYAQAMMIASERYAPQRVHFIVCSDAPQRKDAFGDLNVTISDCSTAADDITLLSHCDVILGTHSTFNRWATLVSDGAELLCLSRTEDGSIAI